MPTSQYDRHTLHCALGSVLSSSHSSVFPTSRIMSFDSLLKGLNCWRCWRSLWSACRWGWFSIFRIKSWMLAPCDCFTAECGSPGMLKSLSSSLIARLNSLSVLNDAMSRFSSRENCSFTVYALDLFRSSGCPDLSWVCSTRVFQTDYQVSPIWRTKFFVQTFFIDLMGTGRFTFKNKHIRFSWLITDWVLVRLVGRTLRVELLHKTVEQVYRLAVVQL